MSWRDRHGRGPPPRCSSPVQQGAGAGVAGRRQKGKINPSAATIAGRRPIGHLPSALRERNFMCRWLTYSGPPIYLEKLLFEPENSLIQQSLHARKARVSTNGDGFGVGWYGQRDIPGTYH